MSAVDWNDLDDVRRLLVEPVLSGVIEDDELECIRLVWRRAGTSTERRELLRGNRRDFMIFRGTISTERARRQSPEDSLWRLGRYGATDLTGDSQAGCLNGNAH